MKRQVAANRIITSDNTEIKLGVVEASRYHCHSCIQSARRAAVHRMDRRNNNHPKDGRWRYACL